MRVFILFGISLICSIGLFSQVEDPVLFYVNENPVHVSEFEYIYNKNNGDNADYSKESIEEYLDLYIKFKLKVERAKEMGLDTVKVLQNELAGYRKQLADSYLLDKEVTKRLLEEAQERVQKDIRVSHILVRLNPKAPKEMDIAAFNKALKIKADIEKSSFESVAKSFSDDKHSAKKGGDIGFLTALMPKGFYAFENQMYSLEKGEISEPVKTKAGYHILQVTDSRPARGEINVSHILIRKNTQGKEVADAKQRIDAIYNLLTDGRDFSMLAKQFSEDVSTANKGGKLGFFGINRFERPFEDVAFSLEKNGDFSLPLETSIGWHIIYRHAKKDFSDVDAIKLELKNKIAKDDRFNIARESLIEKIKQEGNFVENTEILNSFTNLLDKEFYSYKWAIPEFEEKVLFSFNDKLAFTNTDFAKYCKQSTRKRLRFDKTTPLNEAVQSLYKDFTDEKTVFFEESRLEDKYPEFKSLMREYEEGIFLFEATKMEVWDKASLDTVGLQKFYSNNKFMYEWKERAKIHNYSLLTDNEKEAAKIRKYLKKKGLEKALKKYNKNDAVIHYQENTYEQGSRELLGLKWKKGAISDFKKSKDGKQFAFKQIIEIYPSTLKTMAEARGYIIADYQDQLEKMWIADLRSRYTVNIQQETLDNLIKSE
jgi:peptidyl-prolyl cis-trans isomerase SurA